MSRNDFTFNRPLFLLIANHVCAKLGIECTPETTSIMHALVIKRRQYHQGHRNTEEGHAQLRFGGTLGVPSQELKKLLQGKTEMNNESLSKDKVDKKGGEKKGTGRKDLQPQRRKRPPDARPPDSPKWRRRAGTRQDLFFDYFLPIFYLIFRLCPFFD